MKKKKNIKRKFATLVCGIGLLSITSTPVLAQRCFYLSYECCGASHWGDYDLDEEIVFLRIVADIAANCDC